MIPRQQSSALLMLPWLPGGAFGVLWIAVHATLLWAAFGPDHGDGGVISAMGMLAFSLVVLPTSLLPSLRPGISTKFVRTFTLLLPFFLAAVADAAAALIGVHGSGILERLLDLDLRRFGSDLGLFAMLSAMLALYVGGKRVLGEWRILEELRTGRRARR